MANLVAANGQIDSAAEVRGFIPDWRAREELASRRFMTLALTAA
jgi:hypothetical protein